MPIFFSRRFITEFKSLLQKSHAFGKHTQKLTHLGVGGWQSRRPKPSQLTVNSWVGSKKELKAELRVQGTPMHTTTVLTCKRRGSTLEVAGSQCFQWVRCWLSCLWAAQVSFFSHGRKIMRSYEMGSPVLLLSLNAYCLPLEKCQSLTSRTQGALRCQNMDQIGMVLQKKFWYLRVPEYLSETPAQVPCQPLPSRVHSIRIGRPQGRLVLLFG